MTPIGGNTMNLKQLIAPAAVAMALTLGAAPSPADAQEQPRTSHGRSRENAGRSADQNARDRAVARDRTNTDGRARDEARARDQARGQDQARARDQARAQDQARARDQARAQDQARAREQSNAQAAARARDNANRGYQNGNRGYGTGNRAYENRGGGYAVPRYGAPAVRVMPRFQRIAPYRIYTPRPYRSGFSLGIFFGRPVPYRYSYPYPVYGYPAVAPGLAYGGVSFGINPGDADVYVDDQYVGNARDFGGAAQPLTLTAGMHRIELQAPGFDPLVFDINVVPGQVMPYQGGMQPRY
jgi:hypothetical protein